MTSGFILVLFGIVAQVCCHPPDFSSHSRDMDWDCDSGNSYRSYFCTTNFNELVTEKTYPTCPPNTDCVSCRHGGWGWWWHRRPSCHSCCNNPTVETKIVQKTKKVCCPGYYGRNCDRAFCANPCEDLNDTCTSPNTCGPACYPPCRNGGSCVSGEAGNICSCANGWTGTSCETAKQCDDSAENSCKNGGTCNSGQCACPAQFKGVFCDEEICEPECQNGGQCVGQKCNCVDGFSGDFCQIPPAEDQP